MVDTLFSHLKSEAFQNQLVSQMIWSCAVSFFLVVPLIAYAEHHLKYSTFAYANELREMIRPTGASLIFYGLYFFHTLVCLCYVAILKSVVAKKQ